MLITVTKIMSVPFDFDNLIRRINTMIPNPYTSFKDSLTLFPQIGYSFSELLKETSLLKSIALNELSSANARAGASLTEKLSSISMQSALKNVHSDLLTKFRADSISPNIALQSALKNVHSPDRDYTPSKEKKPEVEEANPLEEAIKVASQPLCVILFELLPKSEVSKLSSFVQKEDVLGKKYSSFVLEASKFSTSVEKAELTIIDSFETHLQLIFVFKFKTFPTSTTDAPRLLEEWKLRIDKIRIEIQEKIAKELQGLSFDTNLGLPEMVNLPYLYLYDSNFLLSNIQDRSYERSEWAYVVRSGLSVTDSARGRAEQFFSKFIISHNDKIYNILEDIGIYQNILYGIIPETLIVSTDDKYLSINNRVIHTNFVGLYFGLEKNSYDDYLVNEFVIELSNLISLEIIMLSLEREIESVQINSSYMELDENQTKEERNKMKMLNSVIESLEDRYYNNIQRILKKLKKDELDFSKEETREVYGGKWIYSQDNLSNFFKSTIIDIDTTVQEYLTRKKGRIEKQLELLTTDLHISKNEPKINTLFNEIAPELIRQIEKWANTISQKQIEAWLLNFEDNKDRRVALLLLDKLIPLKWEQFGEFAKILLHRIRSQVPIDHCVFSNIGNITSGSTHIIKLFQEVNGIKDDQIIAYSEISETTDKEILILLDDFIGSGDTYVDWYREHEEEITKKFSRVYYCVLSAFERGIENIKKKSGVETIFGFKHEITSMLTNRSDIDEQDKSSIKELIIKYSTRMPKCCIWGYDDCQLLITFEHNVPNNTIAIFWSENNWIPLISRV